MSRVPPACTADPRSGFTLVLVVAGLVALVGFTGLAIDLGRVYAEQQRLQALADAAVMDGMWLLAGRRPTEVETRIRAHLPSDVSFSVQQLDDPVRVQVTVRREVPLTFLRALPGIGTSAPVAATSVAGASPRRLDIVLVVDDSRMGRGKRRAIARVLGSFMSGVFALNTAADPDRVRVGIVPVAGKVRLLNHLPGGDPNYRTGWKLAWKKAADATRWEAFKGLYTAGGDGAPFDVLPTGTRDIVLDPDDPQHTTVTLDNQKIDRWDLFLAQGCRCYTPYNVDQLYYNFWSNPPMDGDGEDGVARVPGYPLEKASPFQFRAASRFPHVLKSDRCYMSRLCPKISPLVKLTNCSLTGDCAPGEVPDKLKQTLDDIATTERRDRDSSLLVLSEGVKYGAFLLSPGTGYVNNGRGDTLPRCDGGTSCPGYPNYKEFDYWGGDGGSARSPTEDRPVAKIMIVVTDALFRISGSNRGRGGPDAYGGFEGLDYLTAFDRHVLGGLSPDFGCWVADNPRHMANQVPVARWTDLNYDNDAVGLEVRQRILALGSAACKDHYLNGDLVKPDDCKVAARNDPGEASAISVKGPVRVCTFDYHRDGQVGQQGLTPGGPKDEGSGSPLYTAGMEALAIPDVIFDPKGGQSDYDCSRSAKCRMTFLKQYITNLGYLVKEKLDSPRAGDDTPLYPNNLNRATQLVAPTYIYTVGINRRNYACSHLRNRCLTGRKIPTPKDILIDLSSSAGNTKSKGAKACKLSDKSKDCCPQYFRCADADTVPDFEREMDQIQLELFAMVTAH